MTAINYYALTAFSVPLPLFPLITSPFVFSINTKQKSRSCYSRILKEWGPRQPLLLSGFPCAGSHPAQPRGALRGPRSQAAPGFSGGRGWRPGRKDRREGVASEEGWVPALPGPPPAGRDVPGEAAQLSAPAGPPPLSLPRACQLGPNLICVLSVRTPLKPNSAHYQQLSCHTTLVPPGDTLARSGAGLRAPGLWGPFLGLAVSLRLPPRVPQIQGGPGPVTPPNHGTVSQETIGS